MSLSDKTESTTADSVQERLDIDIHRLTHENDKFLALGFLFAILVHGFLFAFVRFDQKVQEIKVPEQMEVRLIIHPPRLTRPLIIPRPNLTIRQELRKQFVQRLPSGALRYQTYPKLPGGKNFSQVPGDYDKVITPEEINALVAQVIAEWDTHYKDTVLDSLNADLFVDDIREFLSAIERDPTEMISLSQSLLKIDDLDNGEYRALAIKDPGRKTNVTGFVYVPAAIWGADTNTAESQTTLQPAQASESAIAGLAQGVTERTKVKLKVDKQLTINSPELLSYPLIYISADRNFVLTPPESQNLGMFLKSGGFVLAEPFSTEGMISIVRMLSEAIQDTVRIETLDSEHPLLHCFYDFENPKIVVDGQQIEDVESEFRVQGLFMDDMLIGLFLNGQYATTWADHDFDNPFFRMGVNAVIYSIIKQGSIAKQYINLDMYGS